MLVDGNDPRGIDVGLLCAADINIDWVRSHVDTPDPASPTGRPLFSRDCPLYRLQLPSGAELYLLLNHLKSQSFAAGNPDPLRSRQSERVRAIYDQLRVKGAELVAVLGDFNKGPDTGPVGNPKNKNPPKPDLSQMGHPLDRGVDRRHVARLFPLRCATAG